MKSWRVGVLTQIGQLLLLQSLRRVSNLSTDFAELAVAGFAVAVPMFASLTQKFPRHGELLIDLVKVLRILAASFLHLFRDEIHRSKQATEFFLEPRFVGFRFHRRD